MTPSQILMIPCGANDAILVGKMMIMMIDDGDYDGNGDDNND